MVTPHPQRWSKYSFRCCFKRRLKWLWAHFVPFRAQNVTEEKLPWKLCTKVDAKHAVSQTASCFTVLSGVGLRWTTPQQHTSRKWHFTLGLIDLRCQFHGTRNLNSMWTILFLLNDIGLPKESFLLALSSKQDIASKNNWISFSVHLKKCQFQHAERDSKGQLLLPVCAWHKAPVLSTELSNTKHAISHVTDLQFQQNLKSFLIRADA